jgi:glyoxylase-like metal-dependent hydrolase (beta-lactamase superfamily II)
MRKTLISAAALLLCLATAQAAAPAATGGSSGFFRTQIGTLEVTALADGVGQIPAALLHGDPAHVAALLKGADIDPAMMPGPVNAYLVNTGAKLILVDAGTGHNWGPPSLGHVIENLRLAGYQPAQVDLILITHVHADHIGGLVDTAGKPLFPKAVVRMAQADSDFWLSEQIAAGAPPEAREFFDVARKAAAPYLKSGQWRPFKAGDNLDAGAGITVLPLPGHTPGHVGYQFQSGAGKLLVWGDTVVAQAVQLGHPEIAIAFDIDAAAATAARQQLFAKLASEGTVVAGAHMPFPGLGRVRTAGSAYRWVPAPYPVQP